MTCCFMNLPKDCKYNFHLTKYENQKGDRKIRQKIDMVINKFSERVQFTALSISFHFMKMTRVKFPKVPLGDVLKEVIEWGSIIGL